MISLHIQETLLSLLFCGLFYIYRTSLNTCRYNYLKYVGDSWTRSHRRWLEELELNPGTRIPLSSFLRQIASLEEEIKILDKEIEALSETDRYQLPAEALIVQIKGGGLLTATVYLKEIGDMRRFSSRKQVGSFLGLVPLSNESGEGSDRKGHITREWPIRVRRVLC